MPFRIEISSAVGFCSGVKRAIAIIEKAARERGPVVTLKAVVHNEQVLERLASLGVTIAESIDEIKGNTVATGAHGVSPEVEVELKTRFGEVISTTCPFVNRAQAAAGNLLRDGFFPVIYGDTEHTEVKGILGWTEGKGLATVDPEDVKNLEPLPPKLGILSQTTQIPSRFNDFVKNILDAVFTRDSEVRIIDTICHDIRARQAAAVELAGRSDLMFVIGSRTSANTTHLAELCSTVTETHFIGTAEEINPAWLERRRTIGVTTGASTSEETINEVIERLKGLSGD